MVDVIAPVIRPVRDAFFGHDAVQLPGAVKQLIFPGSLSDTGDDLTPRVQLHPGMVERHVGQKMDRRIGVLACRTFSCRRRAADTPGFLSR